MTLTFLPLHKSLEIRVNDLYQQLVKPAASLITSTEQYTKVITSMHMYAYSTKRLLKISDENVYSHAKKAFEF